MSATAALSAGVVATMGSPDDVVALTAGLALATGLVALAAGFLRLGFLAAFISEPVLKGFIIGLALTIMVGQVPDLLGDREVRLRRRRQPRAHGSRRLQLRRGARLRHGGQRLALEDGGQRFRRREVPGVLDDRGRLALLTLLFLTGLLERLPEATLAAIVIAAVIELVDISSLRHLWRVGTGAIARNHRITARADFVGALAALLGVLVLDTRPGLVIGIGVSLVLLIART